MNSIYGGNRRCQRVQPDYDDGMPPLYYYPTQPLTGDGRWANVLPVSAPAYEEVCPPNALRSTPPPSYAQISTISAVCGSPLPGQYADEDPVTVAPIGPATTAPSANTSAGFNAVARPQPTQVPAAPAESDDKEVDDGRY